jgi:hypothetical protein
MLNTIWLMLATGVAVYWLVHMIRGVLTEALNTAVDRAINQAVWRLTSTDDNRLYEATRQIVCDGIRRAIKAERENATVDQILRGR